MSSENEVNIAKFRAFREMGVEAHGDDAEEQPAEFRDRHPVRLAHQQPVGHQAVERLSHGDA